jgi:hypothetical protein
MGCRGVHYALTDAEAWRFQTAETNAALIDAFEEIESRRAAKWLQETDSAWDAIHRCLTNGTLERGTTPLHRVIFGDKNLLTAPASGHISLIDPDAVKETAAAIHWIDEEWMRDRYFALDPRQYDGDIGELDFEYTWGWFGRLRAFFEKAAAAERWVSFTVWY